MKINEVKGNIFDLSKKDYIFAHCIATDLHWGAGIAPLMMKEFSCGSRWRNKNNFKVGDIGIDISDKGTLINLFTKGKTSGKPTYQTMSACLTNLKNFMETKKLTKLAIPRLGCGLDKLNWESGVKLIIENIFKDTDIEIEVRYK